MSEGETLAIWIRRKKVDGAVSWSGFIFAAADLLELGEAELAGSTIRLNKRTLELCKNILYHSNLYLWLELYRDIGRKRDVLTEIILKNSESRARGDHLVLAENQKLAIYRVKRWLTERLGDHSRLALRDDNRILQGGRREFQNPLSVRIQRARDSRI